MSSEHRSNSAVRNLRSLFENKSSDPIKDTRGPSSAGTLSPDAQEQQQQHSSRSRVRASFVPVQPSMAAIAAEQQNDAATEHKRESSVGLRRASMSEGLSGDALHLIKDSLVTEADRRGRQGSVAEMIPEQAIETPALEDKGKELGASSVTKEPENPDKPVTGEQEEPADMKPADPASEQAVSGGEALPPVAEDLRKDTKATSSKAATKPDAISTKAPRPSMSSVKSPKSAVSSTSSTKAPAKKPGRPSLTAPTAASVARAAVADKQVPAAAAKPKPRETTKPMDISSRLTAPTAASRARLESASTTAKAPAPTHAQAKPASSRPTPRSSLAGRPESRTSQNATKKPTGPVDSSFLERMSRPTAASAARIHEKTEVKSPPRQKALPMRPKANGHAKSAKAPKAAATEPAEESVIEDESILPQEEVIPAAPAVDGTAEVEETLIDQETVVDQEPLPDQEALIDTTADDVPAVAIKDETVGNETPVDTNGHQEEVALDLEETPAALGHEEAIR